MSRTGKYGQEIYPPDVLSIVCQAWEVAVNHRHMQEKCCEMDRLPDELQVHWWTLDNWLTFNISVNGFWDVPAAQTWTVWDFILRRGYFYKTARKERKAK